jgi:putative hemolysin
MIALEIAAVAVIVLCNGFFAMSELAVVSSRQSRLQQLARGSTEVIVASIGLSLGVINQEL